jgi:CheY-like chemotaxis protein/nitrogen-specific signal transduction histidine kinase
MANEVLQCADEEPGTSLEEIQSSNDELRRRVEELASADSKKNQFLAMLAHELRNPLAALCHGAHILKTPGVTSNADAQARDMIDRQVKNMAQMIDDLLDVQQISRGTIPLRKEPVELALLLERAVELCRSQIESRGQQLTISLPLAPIHLEADPTRLEQAFGNLLDNASKYSERGGRIWLTAESVSSDGRTANEVAVHIRDEGIGIAPEMLPQVFLMFVRANHSLGRIQRGLGIGLTIVHSLIDLHGGNIETRSAGLGQGSEFVVRLPVLPSTDAPLRPDNGPIEIVVADSGPTPAAPPRRRILVVDDNVAVADSLAVVMGLDGHDVQIAYDGSAALDVAASFQPEVTLLDIGMPGMDGYEVAKQLRRRFGNGQTMQLIALTGYGQDEHRVRSEQAGFDAHLVKPVDLHTLEKLLAEIPARAT